MFSKLRTEITDGIDALSILARVLAEHLFFGVETGFFVGYVLLGD